MSRTTKTKSSHSVKDTPQRQYCLHPAPQRQYCLHPAFSWSGSRWQDRGKFTLATKRGWIFGASVSLVYARDRSAPVYDPQLQSTHVPLPVHTDPQPGLRLRLPMTGRHPLTKDDTCLECRVWLPQPSTHDSLLSWFTVTSIIPWKDLPLNHSPCLLWGSRNSQTRSRKSPRRSYT